jgi:hypothetical protein
MPISATDHGLTNEELAQLPTGLTVYFTNHPCRFSVAVTYVGPRGLIEFTRPSGETTQLHAFADELSMEPREGLGF